MLKGIHAGDNGFLVGMDRTEQRIATANTQITTGIRVNQAQDDPFAIQSILDYQGQLDQLTQLQTNFSVSKNDADTADNALQTASNILNQLVSIGSQGSSDLTTPVSRANLATQATQLAQQIIGIANTQVGSRYVFGGDTPTQQPYTLNWTGNTTTGADANPNAAASNTSVLRDGSGTTQAAGMTASEIFDAPGASIFQAAYSLAQALTSNNTTAVSTALQDVKAGLAQLSSAQVFYGNLQSWIQTVTDQSSNQMTSLTQTISSLRDADLPTAITQMTSDQTSLQAALSAHASLSSKTLFDYIG